ncbi:hypothetical protein GCM10010275_72640 [Streptomyces litmocidini]|nr:hypothetical protein GCM10010233_65800 [Streptomyces gancidicus]GGV20897.1 hypothetical protein GCM10010275_72640 [Streptomyces litmocidini]
MFNIKGCYIGKRNHENNIISYYIETTSFKTFKNVINYLDRYPLIGYKYLNYIYIRKAYILIENKEHLTLEGIEKINKYKEKMKYIIENNKI